MAYPQIVLGAIAAKRCRRCDHQAVPALLVSINIHLIVDPKEQTGLRYQLSLICPCGNREFLDLELNRHELDEVVNELRHRGNAPPSRREAHQMYIRGTALPSRDKPRPSNRTAPDRPFTDEEVAKLLQELDWIDNEIGSAAYASVLWDILKLYKPPPYGENDTPNGSCDG